MATTDNHAAQDVHSHDDHGHDEHHGGNFWTKYVFSEDHKVIAKQYLITGIVWALLGGALSVIFRLQLGFPDMDVSRLRPLMGDGITADGKIDPEFFLALVTMHGTYMVSMVLTTGMSGMLRNFVLS